MNDRLLQLPYDNHNGVFAFNQGGVIVLQTSQFVLQYGHHSLKISACSVDMCGLCTIANGDVSVDAYYKNTNQYCTPNIQSTLE